MLLLQSRVGGQLLLDPSAGEARRQDGSALLAMMPATNLVRSAVLAGPAPDANPEKNKTNGGLHKTVSTQSQHALWAAQELVPCYLKAQVLELRVY